VKRVTHEKSEKSEKDSKTIAFQAGRGKLASQPIETDSRVVQVVKN